VRERRLKRLVDRARPAQVGSASLFAVASAAAMTAMLVWPGAPARAQCVTAGANQTCTNSVFLSGGAFGIFDAATLTVTNTNSGTITGTNAGIAATTANVTNAGVISSTGVASVAVFATDTVNLTNSGTIAGTGVNSTGVQALNTASITNSGSISGTLAGIFAVPTGGGLTVFNSGNISGGVVGITAFSSATVVNSGIISGATGVTAGGAGPWSLTNAGIIVGTAGTAIDFGASAGDTMNFLTGSRVIGLIIPGVGDTVNFGAGNWFYTFAGLPGTSINTNGAPFVVAGNQVAVLDPTSLAQTDRTLMTFTGGISALLQSRFDGIAPIGSGAAGVTAFAPTGSVIADQANAAFASIPTVALAYGADDQPLLKTGAASDSARTVIWASSFGGSRHQEADGVVLRTTDTAVGGVFGIDRVITPTCSSAALSAAAPTGCRSPSTRKRPPRITSMAVPMGGSTG
jgi:hypothetical protein